jgi:hypothetical protein
MNVLGQAGQGSAGRPGTDDCLKFLACPRSHADWLVRPTGHSTPGRINRNSTVLVRL